MKDKWYYFLTILNKQNKIMKLQIDEKDALRLYPKASDEIKSIFESTFGKDFFKPKLITDIVFDIDSLCEYLGIYPRDLYIFPKNTTNKHERYINACNILPKIAKVYNEDKILDWKNTNEYKYLPYLSFSCSGSGLVLFYSWTYALFESVALYYKSDILSKASYKNFQLIWEDYWGNKVN